jgi:hypothetical protein
LLLLVVRAETFSAQRVKRKPMSSRRMAPPFSDSRAISG